MPFRGAANLRLSTTDVNPQKTENEIVIPFKEIELLFH